MRGDPSLSSGARRSAAALLLAAMLAGGSSGQGYVIWRFAGPSAGDSLGKAVSGGGDADGDGTPDLVVSLHPALASPSYASGEVIVFSGATGAALLTLASAFPGDEFGFSSAFAGDVDADGRDDVVVGAPWTYLATPGAGKVRVFSGSTGALLHSIDDPNPLGHAVAGAGDVDADGFDDVISAYYSPLFASGYPKVHSGANGSSLFGFLFGLSGTFGQVSTSVARVGDVDGDGSDDVLVGDPGFDAPTAGEGGRARLLSGANGSLLFEVLGTVWGGYLGMSVAGAGDVDGDGVPDWIVGAPGGSLVAGPSGLGQAWIRSGATGAVLLAVGGATPGERFGWSIAGAGDMDGDGVPDLAVGAPHADPAGAGDAGRAVLFSGANGSPLAAFAGAGAGDLLGFCVAGAGDMDGDGFSEVVLGSPKADPGGRTDAGEARVVSYVGIPEGSGLRGAGCPGASGSSPLIRTAGGSPSPGNAGFALVLAKALGGTSALFLAGTVPLALPLDPFGMPGCALLLLPDLSFPATTNALGVAFLPVPIPPVPSLAGGVVLFQAYAVDPGPAPLPGSMTAALRLLVVP